LIIGLISTASGCKDNNIPSPQVEITVFGSNDPDKLWQDTLAIFDSPWGKPLDLEKAKYVQFQIPSTGIHRTDYIHEEAEQKEIYVFQAVRYNNNPETYISSFSVRTPEENSKVKLQGKISKSSENAEFVNYYLFFIQGIGEQPSSPVEISYIPQNNNFEEIPGRVTVNLDPNKHTVPNNPTLFRNWNDLNIDQNSNFYVQFEIKQLSETKNHQPLILTRENKQNNWIISSYSKSPFSFYRRGTPIGKEFELFMYTIDRKDIK